MEDLLLFYYCCFFGDKKMFLFFMSLPFTANEGLEDACSAGVVISQLI